MQSNQRFQVLSLYRKILRLSRSWQALSGHVEETHEERKYIQEEARTLFKKHKEVSEEESDGFDRYRHNRDGILVVITMFRISFFFWLSAFYMLFTCILTIKLLKKTIKEKDPFKTQEHIREAETRLGLAIHYGVPYPRLMNIPQNVLAPQGQSKLMKGQKRALVRASPIYLKSFSEDSWKR